MTCECPDDAHRQDMQCGLLVSVDVACLGAVQERYYREKLEVDSRDPAARRRVVEHYVQARSCCIPFHRGHAVVMQI